VRLLTRLLGRSSDPGRIQHRANLRLALGQTCINHQKDCAMSQTTILYPVVAMLLLVVVVMTLMLRERIAEMKSRRIHPQKVASSSQMSAVLQNTRAADHYKNLFEFPVFFYVLCLALLATQRVSTGFVWAAWAYVALRVVHSFIHLGYNQVMHRFQVFIVSSTLLLGMWLVFAFQLVSKG
jgi:hypothetical protein